MSTIDPRSPLRRVVRADGLISGAMGLVLLAGGGLMADPLGLPESLLRGAGIVLLPFAGGVLWLARQAVPNAIAVKAVIAANAAWVVLSVLVLVTGWVTPSGLGQAFVIVQGLGVAVFAELQLAGWRRANRAHPPETARA